MRPTRSIVGLCSVRRPHFIPLVDQLEQLFFRLHELLLQPENLYLLVLVFQYPQRLMVVEQIVQFASVDLVHRHCDCEVPVVVLEVAAAFFE